MTGVHAANQCKLVFSEYGWPDILISDNGPCYISQAFTSVMQAFSVNHITSSLHYLQSNERAEKYAQIVKCLFNKTKEEGKDLYKCLMIYQNTPLTGSLLSPMQILQGRSARSDLLMSNAARKQLGIQSEVLRNIDKHYVLPTQDLHVGKSVMYQDSVTKQWHPAVITSLCQEKRSYKITTSDSVIYRKTQAHLKPYTPQGKNLQSTQPVSEPKAQSHYMWPVKQTMIQSDHRSLYKLTVDHKHLQADLKGILGPCQA